MAKSEVVEVPTGIIDGANTLFKTPHSYIPGTVSYYLNGLLQHPTSDRGLTETNPPLGLVTLTEAPVPGDVVQFAYTTNEVVYVDPDKPVHISKLAPGDQVDVVLKAGRHLLQHVRNGKVYLEATETVRRIASNVAKTHVVGAYMLSNDRVLGVMAFQVKDHGDYKHATVQYQSVLLLYKRTNGTRRRVRVYF